MEIPKIKKRINAFLVGEEGRISKQALITAGAFLGAAVVGVLSAEDVIAISHVNNIDLAYTGGIATGTHAHHTSY